MIFRLWCTLTMVIMLSSRRIIDWHSMYMSFSCSALGGIWSLIVAILIQLAWCFVAHIMLVWVLGWIILLYEFMWPLVWFVVSLRSCWLYGFKNILVVFKTNVVTLAPRCVFELKIGGVDDESFRSGIFGRYWGLELVYVTLFCLPVLVTSSILVEMLQNFCSHL